MQTTMKKDKEELLSMSIIFMFVRFFLIYMIIEIQFVLYFTCSSI